MSRFRPTVAALVVVALASGAPAQQPGTPPVPTEPSPAEAPPPSTPPPTGPSQAASPRRVPGQVARRTGQGTEALLEKRYVEAGQHYDQAQVKAPDAPELAYDSGLAALLAGKTDDARRAFALTEELRAKMAKEGKEKVPPEALLDDARFNDGHAALQAEDLPGAVTRWASVVAKDPTAPDARKNLELALRMLQVEQQQQQQQQQQDQQDQQQDQQEPQPQQPQDQQEQPQDEQPQPQQPQEQPQQPEERPGELTREQAEKLLEALEQQEKQAMEEKQERQARRGAPASGKIW